MNKYVIDYVYGVACFYTESSDPRDVRREFYDCANDCFGIRKSLGGYEVKEQYSDAALPLPFRGHDATHFLSHHGDEILFDCRFRTGDGTNWKLHSEHGDWCSCKERGEAELACSVHHFYVANHDEICQCTK